MTANATLGVSFSAGSVAKRILLFAINFFVLVLGMTCSILCLYQVKLMPESYDVILAALAEANLTAPPVVIPSTTVTTPATTSDTNNKNRPRVSRSVSEESTSQPQPTSSSLENADAFITAMEALTTSPASTTKRMKSSPTSTTKATLSTDEKLRRGIEGTPSSLEFGFTSSSTSSLKMTSTTTTATSMVTSTSSTSVSQSRSSSTESAVSSSPLFFTPNSIPSITVLPVATSASSSTSPQSFTVLSISSLSVVNSSSSIVVNTLPMTTLSAVASSTAIASMTGSPMSSATSAITSTRTTPDSVSSVTDSVLQSTSTISTSPTLSQSSPVSPSSSSVVDLSADSLLTATLSSITSGSNLTSSTVQTSSITGSITSPVSSETPETATVFSIPDSIFPETSLPSFVTSPTSAQSSTVSFTSSSPVVTTFSAAASSTTIGSSTSRSPSTVAITSTTSSTAAKAMTAKATTTTKPQGFLDISGILSNIKQMTGSGRKRREEPSDLHPLHKRAVRTTTPTPTTPKPVPPLTVDNIPPYFEQIFFMVQTSLYVSIAAGLLVFFASLVGICGGIFRVDGCLKFSAIAVVVVVMAEMATIGFVFVAHDKASNRNKNKNFDENLEALCDVAHFCVNPVMLVMIGSFLCVSVVLQIASITLACNLMDSRNPSDPDKKWRKMMRSGRSEMQLMAGAGNFPFPYSNAMPYCGSGMNPYSSPMMMSNMMPSMHYFPQPFLAGSSQRPVINIIS